MGKFSTSIGAFCKKAKGNARQVEQKLVIDVGEAIVARTPVGDPLTWKYPAPAGYVGGRARGSWGYGFNAEPAPVDEVDSSGDASNSRIASGVQASGGAGVHYIINTLPYIHRLEYDGWSTQAPAGMVRITVQEFEDFINKACREVNP